MENLKFCNILVCLVIACCLNKIKAQEEDLDSSSANSNPSTTLIQPENLESLASNNNVLILVPSGVNLTDSQSMNDADFNLFKLNTDIFFNKNSQANSRANYDDDEDNNDEPTVGVEQDDYDNGRRVSRSVYGRRESRKINFLRGIWNKPRTSPLYLVNGTVCRFVNSVPICTTLSTTGLLPTGGVNGGTTARPASGQVSGGGSSVQFATNQQGQPGRPAAIMDDDTQDINVESSGANSTEGSSVVKVQQQPLRQMTTSPVVQGNRPINYVVNRRPLNFLALRRPVRHYPQTVRGRPIVRSQSSFQREFKVKERAEHIS